MNDFMSIWQSGAALEAPEIIALVRRFTLDCLREFLRRRGTDTESEQWATIERKALGRHLETPTRVKYYTNTPQVEVEGYVVYFKAFGNERFGRYERVIVFRRNRGPVGLTIRIPLQTNDEVHYTIGPVFVGLLWWGTDPGPEQATYERALADAWREEPTRFDRQACGERLLLGRRFEASGWSGQEGEQLSKEIGFLLDAASQELDNVLPLQPETTSTSALHERFQRRGYRFSLEQIATFYAALKAKEFVILSGLSGTGKTKLAQEFAEAMGLNDGRHFRLEPVKPDWRDNTGLLGYWNPVTGEYVATEFLRVLLAAAEEYRPVERPRPGDDLKGYIRRRLGQSSVQTRLEVHRNALRAVGQGDWTDEQLRHLWQDSLNGIGVAWRSGPLEVDMDTLREATHRLADDSVPLAQRALDAVDLLRAAGDYSLVRNRVICALAALEPARVPAVRRRRTLRAACKALGRKIVLGHKTEEAEFMNLARAWAYLEEACPPIIEELGLDPADGAAFTLVIDLSYDYHLQQRRGEPDPEEEAEDEAEAQDEPVRPYFVVLDEMNLARVEYYLADILSVLETGRQEDGFTRGEIFLHGQTTEVTAAGGLRVPPSLRLPPNLYFIGTVNTDETTFAFSPKVLDRAFTMEVREVDLTGYPPEVEPTMAGDSAGDEALLADFTRQGRFAQLSKTDVAAWGRDRREYVALLDDLNQALIPYDLGFGYRVVDEVLAFMGVLRDSPLQAVLSEDEAFDVAVRMKVLPKFHGPFNRLKAPLDAVINWAGDRCEKTGVKAEQMLEKAKTVGHTRFS